MLSLNPPSLTTSMPRSTDFEENRVFSTIGGFWVYLRPKDGFCTFSPLFFGLRDP